MKVVKGQDDAGHVELGGGVREPLASPEQRPQFSAQAGFHQHVEKLCIVICFVEFYNEGAVTTLHYILLIQNMLLLFGVLYLAFLHFLQSKSIVPVVPHCDQLDPTKPTNPKCCNPF